MTSLLIVMALPGFPSALSLIEWGVVIGWFIIGYSFYFCKRHNFLNFQINLKD